MYMKSGSPIDKVDLNNEILFLCASSLLNKKKKLATEDSDNLEKLIGKYPDIDKRLGHLIDNFGIPIDQSNRYWMRNYGLVFDKKTNIGIIQVRYHVKDIVDIDLLKRSAYMLSAFSQGTYTKINVDIPITNDIDDHQILNIVRPIWFKTRISVWVNEYEEDNSYLYDSEFVWHKEYD